jgi:hypothetical protein
MLHIIFCQLRQRVQFAGITPCVVLRRHGFNNYANTCIKKRPQRNYILLLHVLIAIRFHPKILLIGNNRGLWLVLSANKPSQINLGLIHQVTKRLFFAPFARELLG